MTARNEPTAEAKPTTGYHWVDVNGVEVSPEEGMRIMWRATEPNSGRFIPDRAPGGWRTWLAREIAFEVKL